MFMGNLYKMWKAYLMYDNYEVLKRKGWQPIRYLDKNNRCTMLADNLDVSLTMEDGKMAEDYIKYLISTHKELPKRLMWTLKDTNRIDIAEMLIYLYHNSNKMLGKPR